MTKPQRQSIDTTISIAPTVPIFAGLRERLEATHRSAQDAWAVKASAGWRETVVALGAAIRTFDIRAPEIAGEEDMLRLRSELAEMLRSAATAIAPRTA